MTELQHTQLYPIITDLVPNHLIDVTSLLLSLCILCYFRESSVMILTVKEICGDVHKL